MAVSNPAASSVQLHYLPDETQHFKWDNSMSPVLGVESGDIVIAKCREACDGQITADSGVPELKACDWDRIHSLTGPIAVSGALPGDILQVEILDFEHEGWGWTCLWPGYGVLAEDFADIYHLQIWKVDDDGRTELRPGVRIPVEPFCGEMGVAPAADGPHPTMPPSNVGGNLDTRHLCKGSTLFLPVEVPGALFSVGDGHLAQGDGEVCFTAIEAPLTVSLRLSVLKGRSISAPEYKIPGPTTSKTDGMGHYATSGNGLELSENVRNAVRRMVDYLTTERGLTPIESYILCSVAGDLKISVPVLGDGHSSLVTFQLPYSVFV